jgi:hypothetical protein
MMSFVFTTTKLIEDKQIKLVCIVLVFIINQNFRFDIFPILDFCRDVNMYSPRSNMHGRKRPFMEKNGDIRRSYMNTAHGHRIRCATVRNGFRIRRSCKNTEWLKTELLCSVYGRISSCATVYGRIRLQYVSLFRFTLEVSEYINSKCF